jgi:hypothetical protein
MFPRLTDFLEFLGICVHLFSQRTTGPLVGCIGVILAAVAFLFRNEAWILVGSGLFSIGAIVVAALIAPYDAWAAERDARKSAEAKTLQPQVEGEAFDFQFGTNGDSSHPTECNACIHFRLNLSNHSTVATNLTDVEIDAASDPLKPHFEQDVLSRLTETPCPPERLPILRPALQETVQWSLYVTIRGHGVDALEQLSPETWIVHAIDGLKKRHAIHVRAGERVRLRWSSN